MRPLPFIVSGPMRAPRASSSYHTDQEQDPRYGPSHKGLAYHVIRVLNSNSVFPDIEGNNGRHCTMKLSCNRSFLP
jgi:hypothetical protein